MTFEELGVNNLLNKDDVVKNDDNAVIYPSSLSLMPSSEVQSTNLSSGELIGDLLVSDGFIRSFNYEAGVSGWTINADGSVEFESGYFRGDITGATGTFSGTVNVGSLNIPDATTVSSFHIDTNGNAWWGTNVATGYATAPASILANGVAKFTSATIGGWSVNSTSIYTGTEDHNGYTTNAGDMTLYSNGSDASIHAKNFYIDTSGNLTCTSATITGSLTTSSGSSLDAQYISSSTIVNTLTMGSAGTTGYIQSYGWDGSATGFQLKGGSSPALTIIGGTITSGTVQTSSSANTGIKMTSSGLTMHGQDILVYYGSTSYGKIGATNGYFGLESVSNRNIKIKTDSGTTYFDVSSGAGIAPLTSGQGNCGLSSQYWANIYSNNYNFSTSYLNYENSAIATHTHFQPSSGRSYNCGTASYMWSNVYSDAYQVTKSGYTTKYITMNTSNNLEINTGLYVGGTLSKSAGSFTIDHPLKPETHWLNHSFVESPDMLNIYRGNGQILEGECEINMPDWFSPLNGEIKDDYSYQLTSIGQQNNLWVKEEMINGKVIFAGEKDGKFSYIITAIRHDKYAEENRIKVEEEKDAEKKQQYKDKIKLKNK